MNKVRYALLITTALLALLILITSIIAGSLFSFSTVLILAYLGATFFYIFVSEPKLKSSDLLHRAADYTALMTLEIKHQANEAKDREARIAQQKLADAAQNSHRLNVAKDFLEFVRNNPAAKKRYDFDVPQVSARPNLKPNTPSQASGANALPPPASANQSYDLGSTPTTSIKH